MWRSTCVRFLKPLVHVIKSNARRPPGKIFMPSGFDSVGVSRAKLVATAVTLGTGGAAMLLAYCSHRSACVALSPIVDHTRFVGEPITNLETLLQNQDDMRRKMELFVLSAQADIIRELERFEDTKKFHVTRWMDPNEGSGVITCVIEDGDTFEAAHVTVSVTSNDSSVDVPSWPGLKTEGGNHHHATPQSIRLDSAIHPRNPNIPTLYFNYKYVELTDKTSNTVLSRWFEGGTDIVPYILHEDDIRHYHRTLKKTCDLHDRTLYPVLKEECDKHFYIQHRQEHRGLGGIYAKRIDGPSLQDAFQLIRDCVRAVLPGYLPIVDRNKQRGYSYSDRDVQLKRRGRLVEFSLMYDECLKSEAEKSLGGQADNVMVSLPPNARWQPGPDSKTSPEGSTLYEALKTPREWV
ncbi:unnamed protein product [Ixodes hexagonus]